MKRKLSVLVAAVTALSAVMGSFQLSAGAASSFSDVKDDNKYKEAITTLSKLNVINGYEDGTFGPEKSITRAEFTKLVVYMLGYGEQSTKITQFKDVADDHWANANICTAYNLGIVNGYSDTEFSPDSPVTYEQALKMLVCTLGYQLEAEAKGGYPEGYRTTAHTLGLTDKIKDIAFTDNASREIVAQIMFNALEVNLRENDGTGKYELTENNLLNDYLHVHKLKGTVVGVEESITLNCDAGKLNPGFFAIDDDKTGDEYVIDYTEYTQSLSDMTAYLGQTIQIYYREDDRAIDRWLIEIDDETFENKELTISNYDLAEYDNNVIKYYTEGSGKASNARLDTSDLTIRYNGRVVQKDVTIGDNTYSPNDALTQWLDPDSANCIYGTVRLIDSGSTGKYNIVDIYDYETIVAYSAPYAPDFRITDKSVTGNFLVLNPEAVDYKVSVSKNGSNADVTSISSNDVICYALNLDGDYYTVQVNSESISGTITSLNLSDKVPTISINGTEHRVSQRFLNYITDKDKSKLETGSSITAYPDVFGTLEWGTITKTTNFYPYAYVINVATEAEEYFVKMFAPTNPAATSFSSSTQYKVRNFKIQENNPKLNGKKSSPESIVSALAAHAELPDENIPKVSGIKGTGYNQLVKIGFNTEGQISDVIILDNEKNEQQNEDNGTLARFKAMDPEAKYYVTSSSVKASATGTTYYSLKSNTPTFVIPKDRTNESGYSLKSAITTNSMSSGGSYYLDAYDVSTTKYPAALCVYNTTFKSGTSITYTTAYRLLNKNIDEEYDEKEGDIFNKLYTYNSATTITSTNISNDFASDFKSSLSLGDIFLNGTDGDKYADTFIKAIDYDDILEVLNGAETPILGEEGEVIGKETYNWRRDREQTADNYYQRYAFDFRYPKTSIINAVKNQNEPSESELEKYWLTGGNVTGISSRAFMCNIMQVLTAENLLYVTQDGFDESGALNESNYMEIKTSSSTKIVRYDKDEKEFTPYAKGSESTALTVQDLKEAINYGSDCSKVLITYVSGSTTTSTATPTARFIVIYE